MSLLGQNLGNLSFQLVAHVLDEDLIGKVGLDVSLGQDHAALDGGGLLGEGDGVRLVLCLQLFADGVDQGLTEGGGVLLVEENLGVGGDIFCGGRGEQLNLLVIFLRAQHLQCLLEGLLDGLTLILQHHVAVD